MTKDDFYTDLNRDLNALMTGETSFLIMMANASALLYERLENINWVGFYLLSGNQLTLGPFQGKIACTRIPYGKGVCGSAVAEDRIMRVADVHTFDGHIACDSQTNSELVLPIRVNNQTIGVLDIDSTVFSRFTEQDERGLSSLVELFSALAKETDYQNFCSLSA